MLRNMAGGGVAETHAWDISKTGTGGGNMVNVCDHGSSRSYKVKVFENDRKPYHRWDCQVQGGSATPVAD